MSGDTVNSSKYNRTTTQREQQAKQSKFISFLLLASQCILEDLQTRE